MTIWVLMLLFSLGGDTVERPTQKFEVNYLTEADCLKALARALENKYVVIIEAKCERRQSSR